MYNLYTYYTRYIHDKNGFKYSEVKQNDIHQRNARDEKRKTSNRCCKQPKTNKTNRFDRTRSYSEEAMQVVELQKLMKVWYDNEQARDNYFKNKKPTQDRIIRGVQQ